mgnify:CR=1 FL=1
MKEIEVGEYVRTNKGNIGKVVEIRLGLNKDTELYQNVYMLDNGLWTILDYIANHSKQLIDLIEVGDFVNGRRIINEIWGEDDNNLYFEIEGRFNKSQYIGENDIKTILTKEQFDVNCYEVGGEDESN